MIYALIPRYSSRKSFYGKAQIKEDFFEGKKIYELYSYGTLVASIVFMKEKINVKRKSKNESQKNLAYIQIDKILNENSKDNKDNKNLCHEFKLPNINFLSILFKFFKLKNPLLLIFKFVFSFSFLSSNSSSFFLKNLFFKILILFK